MAKSKNGGTRSMLRGRVGADVYSVGKDSQGKRQQVVRSLAEVVANPQTLAQMKGRCIMSTVMQAVSALSQVIDHSFDNVAAGQPNVSEFIRRNYALIKADVEAHPSTSNTFGIVKYGEKGAKQGVYVISDGKAIVPAALVKSASYYQINISGNSLTFGAIKTALGLADNEYFTLVGISAAGAAEIARFRLGSTLSDETAITSSNVADVFAIEANCTPAVAVTAQPGGGNLLTIALPNAQANSAIIVSKIENGVYKHNNATLASVSAPTYTYNEAIETYPQGEARLLNGGNFNGGEHGGDTPAPQGDPAVVSGTFAGQALVIGGTIDATTTSGTLAVTLDHAPESNDIALYQSTNNVSIGTKIADITGTTWSGTVDISEKNIIILVKGSTNIQVVATIYQDGD